MKSLAFRGLLFALTTPDAMKRSIPTLAVVALGASVVAWLTLAGDVASTRGEHRLRGVRESVAAAEADAARDGERGGERVPPRGTRGPSGVGRERTPLLEEPAEPASDPQRLVVLLRDERGRPWAEERFSYRIHASQARADSDANGRLEIGPSNATLAGLSSWLVVTSPEDEYGNANSVHVQVPDELTPGLHDLGEVRFPPMRLLVAGTVVDADGGPLPEARVVASVRVDRTTPLRRKVDARGRFSMRGDPQTAGIVALKAELADHAPARIEVPVGTADVTLVLRRYGSISGRIMHGVAGAPENLRVRATAWDGGELEAAAPHRDGRFLFPHVPPDTYRLDVVLGDSAEPLLRVENVEVGEGARVWPASLNPLDLRRVLHAFVVRVRAPDRVAVTSRISFRASGGPADAPWNTLLGSGRTYLVTTSAAIDVRVEADGYAPAERRDVVDGAVFDLERELQVELQARVPASEECRYEVTLSGAPLGTAGETTRALTASTRGDGFGTRLLRTRLIAAAPGELRVRVTRRCATPESDAADEVERVFERVVHVRRSGALQRLLLELP